MISYANALLQNLCISVFRLSQKSISYFIMTITTCDVLLTLVPSLQVGILVEWLSLKDVGRLDSAICSSQHRELLMCIFKEEYCVFNEPSKNNFGQFLWINHRGIKMADIEVPRPFQNVTLHPTFFEVSGKNLQRLNVSNWLDSVKDVAPSVLAEKLAMLSICVNLRQLELSFVDLQSLDIGPFLAALPQLQYLDLSHCANINSEMLFGITKHVKKLQTLDLSKSHISAGPEVEQRPDNHTIHTLYLRNMGLHDVSRGVTFALTCKALRVLYVESAYLDVNVLFGVLAHWPSLRVFSARVLNDALTAEQTNALIPLIQKLEFLHLCNNLGRLVNDQQVRDIVSSCPNLKALLVKAVPRHRGSAEKIMSAALASSTHVGVHQLNTLCVGSLRCDTLQAILHCCPLLTTLRCTDTWDDTEIGDLMTIIGQSTITSVAFLSGDVFTSSDFLPLCNLSSFTLCRCNELTHQDVVGIVDRNPHLRALSLTEVPLLHKKTILYIIKHCKFLEELTFSNEDPDVAFFRRTMEDTSLWCETVQFFQPKLKQLSVQLVEIKPIARYM